MSQTIHPTHTCFDDALDAMEQMVLADRSLARGADVLLVHGVLDAGDGRELAHAWLELAPGRGRGCGDDVAGVKVLFAGILRGRRQHFAAPREQYYAEMRVRETTKYTPRQAWDENRRSGTFGPWLERYRALCAPRGSLIPTEVPS